MMLRFYNLALLRTWRAPKLGLRCVALLLTVLSVPTLAAAKCPYRYTTSNNGEELTLEQSCEGPTQIQIFREQGRDLAWIDGSSLPELFLNPEDFRSGDTYDVGFTWSDSERRPAELIPADTHGNVSAFYAPTKVVWIHDYRFAIRLDRQTLGLDEQNRQIATYRGSIIGQPGSSVVFSGHTGPRQSDFIGEIKMADSPYVSASYPAKEDFPGTYIAPFVSPSSTQPYAPTVCGQPAKPRFEFSNWTASLSLATVFVGADQSPCVQPGDSGAGNGGGISDNQNNGGGASGNNGQRKPRKPRKPTGDNQGAPIKKPQTEQDPKLPRILLELYEDDSSPWEDCVYKQSRPIDRSFANAKELEQYLQSHPTTKISYRERAKNLLADAFPKQFTENQKKIIIAQYYAYMNQLIDAELATIEAIYSLGELTRLGQPYNFDRRDYFSNLWKNADLRDPLVPQTTAWNNQLKECSPPLTQSHLLEYFARQKEIYFAYEITLIELQKLRKERESLLASGNTLNRANELQLAIDKSVPLLRQLEASSPWLKDGRVRESALRRPGRFRNGAFKDQSELYQSSLDFDYNFGSDVLENLPALIAQFRRLRAAVSCLNSDYGSDDPNCEDFAETLAAAPAVRFIEAITDRDDPRFPGAASAGRQLFAQNYLFTAECIGQQRIIENQMNDVLSDAAINVAIVGLTVATMGTGSVAASAFAAGRSASAGVRLAQSALWAADIGFAIQGGVNVLEACSGGLKGFSQSLKTFQRDPQKSEDLCTSRQFDLKGAAALYNVDDCILSAVIDGAFNAVPAAVALREAVRYGKPAAIAAQIKFGRTFSAAESEGFLRAERVGLGTPGRNPKIAGVPGNRNFEQTKRAIEELNSSGFAESEIRQILSADINAMSPAQVRELLALTRRSVKKAATGFGYIFNLGKRLSEREFQEIVGIFPSFAVSRTADDNLRLIPFNYFERMLLEEPEIRGKLLIALSAEQPGRELKAFIRVLEESKSKLSQTIVDLDVFFDRLKLHGPQIPIPPGGMTVSGVLVKAVPGQAYDAAWVPGLEQLIRSGETAEAIRYAHTAAQMGADPTTLTRIFIDNGTTVTHATMDNILSSSSHLGNLLPEFITRKFFWWKAQVTPRQVGFANSQLVDWMRKWRIEDVEDRLRPSFLQSNYLISTSTSKADPFYQLIPSAVKIRSSDIEKFIVKTKASPLGPVWEHPIFWEKLRELEDAGYELVVDTSQGLLHYGAHFYSKNAHIALQPDSTFAVFIHELEHLKFDKALTTFGGFDRYVNQKLSAKELLLLRSTDPMRYRAIELSNLGIPEYAINEILATEAEAHTLRFSGWDASPVVEHIKDAQRYGLKHLKQALSAIPNRSVQQQLALEIAKAGLDQPNGLDRAKSLLNELAGRELELVKYAGAMAVGGPALLLSTEDEWILSWTDPTTRVSGELRFPKSS